jgi:hypothetical protein
MQPLATRSRDYPSGSIYAVGRRKTAEPREHELLMLHGPINMTLDFTYYGKPTVLITRNTLDVRGCQARISSYTSREDQLWTEEYQSHNTRYAVYPRHSLQYHEAFKGAIYITGTTVTAL